jgi:hypothetical protein
MLKQIVTRKMEGRRKRGRPCERWRYEVEENLYIMGMKIRQATSKKHQEWNPSYTMHCSALKRVRKVIRQ